MFGSDIIDAAIGLFLVYLLFSVLSSALNEWIVGHLRGMRAKMLEQAIERMLASPELKKEFYDLPLIKSLASSDKTKPSYISSEMFLDSLVTLLKNKAKAADANLDQLSVEKASENLESLTKLLRENLGSLPVQPILLSLLSGARDIDDARRKLEVWFNEAMERASGWYKKHVQICMAIIAVGLAVIFNVDTFTIARELLGNSQLRAVLVASAEETVKQNSITNSSSTDIAQMAGKIQSLNLPIGWPACTNFMELPSKGTEAQITWLRPGETLPMKIGGLLVTAGAISMGAPFWFDLLGKLVNLRAAGSKPAPTKRAKPQKQTSPVST